MNIKHSKLPREEIARIEVGQTNIARGTSVFMVVAFLGAITLFPLLQYLHEVDGHAIATIGAIPPSATELAQVREAQGARAALRQLRALNNNMGREISNFEDRLDDRSFGVQRLTRFKEILLAGSLKWADENTYFGVDGWLFFRPGIDYITGRGFLTKEVLKRRSVGGKEWETPPQPDPIAAIVEFKEQLAQRDIDLVVMPVPAKAMIYPEKFVADFAPGDAPLHNPSFDAFKRRLEDVDVHVFDPAPALYNAKAQSDPPLFLKTDTHWSPSAVLVTSKALTEFLAERNLVPPSKPQPYMTKAGQAKNSGDIEGMIKQHDNLRVLTELILTGKIAPHQTVNYRQVYTAQGALWSSDPEASILFLGDSYANIYSIAQMGWGVGGGIVENLSSELRRPIETIRANDNGAFATRQQLARDIATGNDRLAGKRLLIWEFAIRELSFGDWKTGFDFSAPSGAQTTKLALAPATVRATIKDISRPPEPGSMPYPESIVAIHLTDIEIERGRLSHDEIIVFMWGMRKNVHTPAARLQPGQSLLLSLIPWDDAEEDYGFYNRVELDDVATIFMDTYWSLTDPDTLSSESLAPHERESEVPTPIAPTDVPAIVSNEDTPFLQMAASLETHYRAKGQKHFRGRDDWIYRLQDLALLNVGTFWESEATEEFFHGEIIDPHALEAIVDFKEQLDSLGVELIFMPVPNRVTLYPETISRNIPYNPDSIPRGSNPLRTEFLNSLKDRGVNVIDLLAAFTPLLDDGNGDLCSHQDTHWSPRACEVAAQLVYEQIQDRPWLDGIAKTTYSRERISLELSGDLWENYGDESIDKEQLEFAFISQAPETRPKTPVEPWRESPILIMGDSHCTVFHGWPRYSKPRYQSIGAGVSDNIAYRVGFPIDIIANSAGGANSGRIDIARRGDNLEGKKLVVWCFTEIDFTFPNSPWRKIPIKTR